MKTHFLFIENGTPVEQIKNAAKRDFKAKKFDSLSEAQNALTRSYINKSFNKATNEAKNLSPFVIKATDHELLNEDSLFLPIKVTGEQAGIEGLESFYYYIVVCKSGTYLGSDNLIEHDGFVIDVNEIKLNQIDMIDDGTHKGWSVDFGTHVLVAKANSEGIVADLWDQQLEECNGYTSYIFYNECMEYHHKSIVSGKTYSDYEASIAIGHDSDSDSSSLLTVGGLELTLSSCITVTTPDDGYVFGGQRLLDLADTEDERNTVMAWLHGQDVEQFDSWEVETAPYYSVNHDNGDPASEVFGLIPATLQDRILLLATCFASKN
ncbi:hypothetical protein OTK49_21005 [Vibrio coralliirubri]|uniref:hypothetical protein n=1 Tax=Vibrio coralliirubri TaxID=1516159 RepID=UPI0022853958|nr:hypothetical protein [Vibrio coralliirubri]MCY9864999.1 hypothetical protein [Vibrio coralliirubri]